MRGSADPSSRMAGWPPEFDLTSKDQYGSPGAGRWEMILMKKCPYCAEEIQGEAVICKHCGRGQPEDLGDIKERGERYAMGITQGGEAAIWDMKAGGPPLAKMEAVASNASSIRSRFNELESASDGKTDNSRMAGGILIMAGGLLLCLGSFLPWVTANAPLVGSMSKSGMEGGDGIITLILGIGIAALGIGFLAGMKSSSAGPLIVLIAAVAAAAVTVVDYNDVQGRVEDAQAVSDLVSASVGAGIWTLFVGSIVSALGSLSFLRK